MMRLLVLLTLLFAGIASAARVTNPKRVPRNAALLSKISAITVRAGKQTESRRVAPVPQLQCVGPAEICRLYSIDVMRCTNEGVDYDENNVQWSCKASLPEEFKLGSTDVTCEGYESSEDPYVLKGSCGVEYRLLLTEKGEEKYGSQINAKMFSPWNSGSTGSSSEKWAGYVFMAVFVLVLFIILRGLYNAWRTDPAARRRQPPRPRGWGGGGGGGGDDNNDDPPPPYDPRPPSGPPRPKKPSNSSAWSSWTSPQYTARTEGWRPGFWTGTAAGAAAAYAAGRAGAARTQPEPPLQRRPAARGWFGGGAGADDMPGPSTRRTTPSSPSFSTSRHESTGFGGTSRR